MNKNFKVITINGIRGMIVAVFVVLGLIAGFIISPGWVCMKTWNYFMESSTMFSLMNIYQGIMCWAMIALALYALNGKRSLIGFGTYSGLSPHQIKDIMKRAKAEESNILKELDKKIEEKQKSTFNNDKSMLNELIEKAAVAEESSKKEEEKVGK